MISIAVCDDEKEFTEKMEKMINLYFQNKNTDFIVSKYTSGKQLTEQNPNADIIFLDVEMQLKNGIKTAEEIRKQNRKSIIVFVSAYISYAMFGYEVDAYRYILKKDIDRLFAKTMDDIMKKFYSQEEKLNIVMNYMPYSVKLNDIVYIESNKRVLEINTCNQNEKYTHYGKISDFALMLENKGFLKIQRSYIVNMQYICDISNYYVTLNDGTKLKTTLRNYNKLIEKWMLWKGEF